MKNPWDLHYETLEQLNQADLNQRYQHTYLGYNGRIRECLGFGPNPSGKPIHLILLKRNNVEDPPHDEDGVPLPDGVEVAGQDLVFGDDLARRMPPPPPMNAPQEVVRAWLQLDAQRRMERRDQIGQERVIQDGRIEDLEVAPGQLVARKPANHTEAIPFESKKVLLSRPPAGYYYYGTHQAGFLIYHPRKQFSRGFCMNNTSIWTPNWGRLPEKTYAKTLQSACFGVPPVRIRIWEMAQLPVLMPEVCDSTILDRFLLLYRPSLPKKKEGPPPIPKYLILHKNKSLGYIQNEEIVCEEPLFADEIREAFPRAPLKIAAKKATKPPTYFAGDEEEPGF